MPHNNNDEMLYNAQNVFIPLQKGATVNREIFGVHVHVQIFSDHLWYAKIKSTKIC